MTMEKWKRRTACFLAVLLAAVLLPGPVLAYQAPMTNVYSDGVHTDGLNNSPGDQAGVPIVRMAAKRKGQVYFGSAGVYCLQNRWAF